MASSDSPRLVVVGPAAAGKSALCHAFMYRAFISQYDPTIEDTYRKAMVAGTGTVNVEITDTAGVDNFTNFRKSAIMSGTGFILCVPLNKPYNDEEIKVFIDDIIDTKEAREQLDSTFVAVTGTKADLERAVTSAQLEKVAAVFSTNRVAQVRVFETSSKNLNVEEPFNWLTASIVALKPPVVVPKGSSGWCQLL